MAKISEIDLDALLERMVSTDHRDRALVTRAYTRSKTAHEGTVRFSGEPYFSHVYQTAFYLAELGADAATIAAGLLHDALEDANVTREELQKEFGDEILFLVEGVTKLGKLQYHGLARHTGSLRKLLVAVAEDVRVLLIKFADRLHNMETLEHVPSEKQKRIALETLEIYAPLAHRLGIGSLKGRLEDLAFRFTNPSAYEATQKLLKTKGRESAEHLKKVSRALLSTLAKNNITVIRHDYRIKHLYSLHKKLSRKGMTIDQVYDTTALRIIVSSVEDCYRALGAIHRRWKPLPGRIKDYIATPKPNGYQSLHTTVFTGDGGIVEVQIRTQDMHDLAERGVASHVTYKEGRVDALTSVLNALKTFGTKDRYSAPSWLSKLSKLDGAEHDPRGFLKTLKTDLFAERVFVFTPEGDVIDLPLGSTSVDFAYAIHSDLGDHMNGARINGKLASFDTKLNSGDIVEIIERSSAKPSDKWLAFAKTTSARKKIRGATHKKSSK